MFVYLKQGKILKKKESLLVDPNSSQSFSLQCSKPDHQENAMNIVCFDPLCAKRGLLCSACYFQDHVSHSNSCCNLKDFLRKYKDFLIKEKEKSQKDVKESDLEGVKRDFEDIYKLMAALKANFEESYAKLEADLKQKELFLSNSLQNKNLNDLSDLINNLLQGSFTTLSSYNEAINYILEGLSGSLVSELKDEKIKQDLLPNPIILTKSQNMKQNFEKELKNLENFFKKISSNCQDILLEKKTIMAVPERMIPFENEFGELFGDLFDQKNQNLKLSRIYKAREDGFTRRSLENRVEGKKPLFIIIRGDKDLGLYLEKGLFTQKDNYYMIFSLDEKKLLKKGNYWGDCCCENKNEILLTSSNLHEIVIFENKNHGVLDIHGVSESFKVIDIEIYEIFK